MGKKFYGKVFYKRKTQFKKYRAKKSKFIAFQKKEKSIFAQTVGLRI